MKFRAVCRNCPGALGYGRVVQSEKRGSLLGLLYRYQGCKRTVFIMLEEEELL